MPTKNIVPRANGEGSLGTSLKKWGAIYANEIVLANEQTLEAKLNAQDAEIAGKFSQQDTTIGTAIAAQDESISTRLSAQDGRLDAIDADVASRLSTQDETISSRLTAQDALLDEKVDLSGGTMTGNLAPTSLYANRDTSEIGFLGVGVGSAYNVGGGALACYGAGRNDALKGMISLRAQDGSNISTLNCYPNGDLTWGGKDVAVVSYGQRNIKFDNGIMILWGTINNSSASVISITFEEPFVRAPYLVFGPAGGSAHNGYCMCRNTVSATKFDVYTTDVANKLVSNNGNDWLAMGWWK